VSIGAAGALSGVGTVSAAVAVAGAVSPGNSPGTINSGSVTFTSGSIYKVDVDGTQADQLAVTGTVTLAGARWS